VRDRQRAAVRRGGRGAALAVGRRQASGDERRVEGRFVGKEEERSRRSEEKEEGRRGGAAGGRTNMRRKKTRGVAA
jgi:hypothetical protein